MKVIQIGSFAIMLKWLLFGAAIILGLIILKLWLQRTQRKEINKKIFDLAGNSLFWGFISWKLSLLLIEPTLVIKSPLSLLYFTGGSSGLLLAVVIALLYFFYKTNKQEIPDLVALQAVFLFSTTATSSYHLLSLAFKESGFAYHLVMAIIAFLPLLLFFTKSRLFLDKKTLVWCLTGVLAAGTYDVVIKNEDQSSDNINVEATNDIGVEIGNKAPDFLLEALDGQMISLSDFAGKKVILNFWATWCPPCKAEMPHMEDFYQEQKNNGVEILAVNLTSSEKSEAAIEAFVTEKRLTFPVLFDQSGEISDLYQAITIPTSYVIDSDGRITKKIVGPMNKNMLYDLVNSVK